MKKAILTIILASLLLASTAGSVLASTSTHCTMNDKDVVTTLTKLKRLPLEILLDPFNAVAIMTAPNVPKCEGAETVLPQSQADMTPAPAAPVAEKN